MLDTTTIYSDILIETRTKAESTLLSTELDFLLQALFKTDTTALQDGLRRNVRYKAAAAFQEALSKNAIMWSDTEKVTSFIEGLKHVLETLPVFHLTVAFEPSEETIQTMISWIRTNIHEQVLLDYTYDPRIIGGILIEWNGKYQDLSVRRKLEEG